MKLYLSSIAIPTPDDLLALLPQVDSLSVAMIANAWDLDSATRTDPIIMSLERTFLSLGLRTTKLDLRRTTGEELSSQLAQHQLVWFMSGNTFYLNALVHASGLHQILPGLMKSGLVYGGESAGAVIAGTTLRGVEHLDDPKPAPKL